MFLHIKELLGPSRAPGGFADYSCLFGRRWGGGVVRFNQGQFGPNQSLVKRLVISADKVLGGGGGWVGEGERGGGGGGGGGVETLFEIRHHELRDHSRDDLSPAARGPGAGSEKLLLSASVPVFPGACVRRVDSLLCPEVN